MGSAGEAMGACCTRCCAAAPPMPPSKEESAPRKRASSSRRRFRVCTSTFSAKTEKRPLLSDGSAMKRTTGRPTKT